MDAVVPELALSKSSGGSQLRRRLGLCAMAMAGVATGLAKTYPVTAALYTR